MLSEETKARRRARANEVEKIITYGLEENKAQYATFKEPVYAVLDTLVRRLDAEYLPSEDYRFVVRGLAYVLTTGRVLATQSLYIRNLDMHGFLLLLEEVRDASLSSYDAIATYINAFRIETSLRDPEARVSSYQYLRQEE